MIKKSLLMVGLVSLAIGSTTVNAGEVKVHYQGDHAAKTVCTSIVNDDAQKMKRAFKRAASFSPIPYNKVHKYYSCNDLALIDFAYEWEATRVIGYLESRGEQRGNVTMEEVASR